MVVLNLEASILFSFLLVGVDVVFVLAFLRGRELFLRERNVS